MLQVVQLKEIENALSTESDEAKMPIGESCEVVEPCTELTSPLEEKSFPTNADNVEEVLEVTQPKLLEAKGEEKPIVSPPTGDIISTAFRIGDSEADVDEETSMSGEDANVQNKSDEKSLTIEIKSEPKDEVQVISTTLHFKSGLSMPISAHSASNKKVIANAARANKISSTPKSNIASTMVTKNHAITVPKESEKKGDDVHQSLNFSALSAGTVVNEVNVNVSDLPVENTENNSDVGIKKKTSQRIAQAKQSASRAMLASSNEASANRLLKNLRVVFRSAYVFTTDGKTKNSNGGQKVNDSVMLTLDPSYLHERAGMQFLNDVESVIECELRKTNGTKTCKFLSDDYRLQQGSDDDDEAVPQWLAPFLQSQDSEVSLVLILLSRIESSIMLSYKKYRGANQGKPQVLSQDKLIDVKVDGKDMTVESNLVTPPSSPLLNDTEPLNKECTRSSDNDQPSVTMAIDGVETIENIDCGNDEISTKSVAYNPEWLHTKPSDGSNSEQFLSNIFKSYKQFEGQKGIEDVSSIPHISTSPLRIQDLLLVPAERLSLVCTSDSTGACGKGEIISEIITKWNKIINTAKKVVENNKSNRSKQHKISVSDEEVYELFADEVPKATKSKKKKKKKKKVSATFNFEPQGF